MRCLISKTPVAQCGIGCMCRRPVGISKQLKSWEIPTLSWDFPTISSSPQRRSVPRSLTFLAVYLFAWASVAILTRCCLCSTCRSKLISRECRIALFKTFHVGAGHAEVCQHIFFSPMYHWFIAGSSQAASGSNFRVSSLNYRCLRASPGRVRFLFSEYFLFLLMLPAFLQMSRPYIVGSRRQL